MKHLVTLVALVVAFLAALPALAAPVTTKVSGTITFEDAMPDRTPQGLRPVRFVAVQLWDQNTPLSPVGVTDAMGHYTVNVPTSALFPGDKLSVSFYSENPVASVKLDTDGIDDYLNWTASITLRDTVKPIVLNASVPISLFSQHFSIMDALTVGHDYAHDRLESDDELFQIQVQYPDEHYTASDDNVLSADCITVHGPEAYGYGSTDPADPDPDDGFDDRAILHEYGHILEYQVSSIDTPGGPHDEDCPWKGNGFSWAEGWATYFAYAVWDHDPTPLRGRFFGFPEGVDLCSEATEYKVLGILWDLHDEVGDGLDVFDRVDGRVLDAAGRPAYDVFMKVFDTEMEDQVEPTIFGFHDALVARDLHDSFLHADIDRIFRDNGINPPHPLSNYAVVSAGLLDDDHDPLTDPNIILTHKDRLLSVALSNDGGDYYADEKLRYDITLTPPHGGGAPITVSSPPPLDHFATSGSETLVQSVPINVGYIPDGSYTLSVVVDPEDRFPRSTAGAMPSRFDIEVQVANCGNGTCQKSMGETCASCPGDCGPCMGCHDGFCIPPENTATCVFDCPIVIGP